MSLANLPSPTFSGADLSVRVNATLQEARAARRVPSVAALLADATLGYAGSRPVAPGDRIVTAEGFAYEVAGSAATDHHLATAGGVKLKVVLGGTQVYPAAFGINGNGTDVTAKWMAMRDALRALGPTKHWHIHLDGGSYIVRDRRWLHWLRRYTIHGCGSTVTNDLAPENPLAYLEIGRTPFGDPSEGGHVFGHLIKTNDEFKVSADLATTAHSSSYAVGDLVLLYGFNMMDDGWPPNPRFFEWNRVAYVLAEFGAVGLDRPTKWQYRSDWPEGGNFRGVTLGRARILNATTQGMCEFAEWRDLNVPTVLHGDARNSVFSGALDVVMRNCRLGTYAPTMGRQARLYDCHVDYLVLDKIIEDVEMIGGSVSRAVGDGTAVQNLVMKGVLFHPASSFETYGPRRVVLDRCSIHSKTVVGGQTYSIRLAGNNFSNQHFTVRDCDIFQDPATTYERPIFGLGASGGPAVLSVTGSTVTVNVTDSGTIQLLQRGTRWFTQTGKTGVVDQIRQGATYGSYLLDLSTDTALTTADRIYAVPALSVDFSGTQLIRGSQKRMLSGYAQGDMQRGFVSRAELDFTRAANDVNNVGLLTRVEVDVVRPYTGPAATATLGLYRYLAGTTLGHVADVNLRTAGRRTRDLIGSAGAVAGDNLGTGGLTPTRDAVSNYLRGETSTGAGATVLTGTPEQMPVVFVTTTVQPIA